MSPIKGISEIRRMPRLGKIRLGIKIEEPKKNPYPRPTDYFVVPEIVKKYLDGEADQAADNISHGEPERVRPAVSEVLLIYPGPCLPRRRREVRQED